jgi:SpoVK/Ycf46/Vps4 family AAA+-type ATPase
MDTPITPRKRKCSNTVNILEPVRKKRRLNLKYPKHFTPSIQQIETLGDLIHCIKEWKVQFNPRGPLSYTDIEYQKLSSILPELRKLNKLIGMESLKKSIVQQIIMYIQNLHGSEMKNMILTGEPGTGKTTVCQILARIYSKIGILSEDAKFQTAHRSDLVAGYLGQTAKKTLKFLTGCKGGVVFIDEAYSLGHDADKGDHDSFSRECLNTLNQFLSENSEDIVCIMAGYEDELERNVFALNPGLRRRFPWKFAMQKYTYQELKNIFLFRLKRDKWNLDDIDPDDLDDFFKENKHFQNNGGDCETFLNRCKIAHSKRVFMLPEQDKKKARLSLSFDDIQNGFKDFKNNQNSKKNDTNTLMYL